MAAPLTYAAKCSRFSNFISWKIRRALAAVDASHPPRDPAVLRWLAARRRAGATAGATPELVNSSWAVLSAFGLYIDDGAGASIDDLVFTADGVACMRDGVQLTRSQLHFDTALAVLREIGHASEPSKEQPPSGRQLLSLGAVVDVSRRQMRLDDKKRSKYAARARALAAERTCRRGEMVAMLGRLQFAAAFYPLGRQWLHAPWRAVRAQFRLRDDHVMITPAVRAALLRWAVELEAPHHQGVPLASHAMGVVGDGATGAIYADASGGCGYLAWTVRGTELLYVAGEWSEAERIGLPIAEKELIASTLGLVVLGRAVGAQCIYSFTDNTVAQAAMRSLTPTSAAMQHLVHRRTGWLVSHSMLEWSERITSKANLWADLGSRGRIDEVVRQAQRLGLSCRELYPSAAWRDLAAETLAVAA